jgi:hypothetical protein
MALFQDNEYNILNQFFEEDESDDDSIISSLMAHEFMIK